MDQVNTHQQKILTNKSKIKNNFEYKVSNKKKCTSKEKASRNDKRKISRENFKSNDKTKSPNQPDDVKV